MAKSKKEKKMRKGFFLGAILGSIAGGLAALFYAPKSGKQMRREFSKKCCDAKEKTEEWVECITEKTNALVETAKDIATDAKDAANKIFKDKKR
jgi:gas vesicle protein